MVEERSGWGLRGGHEGSRKAGGSQQREMVGASDWGAVDRSRGGWIWRAEVTREGEPQSTPPS